MLNHVHHAFARRALALALLAAPGAARAQLIDRVYAHVEGGAGTMLTAPQSERYGLGLHLGARVGVRLVDALGLHVVAGTHLWRSGDGAFPDGRLTTLGLGARFSPRLGPGRALVDLEGAFSVTGAAALERPHLSAGVGWLLPIGRALALGPVLRYGHVFPSEAEREASSQSGSGAAQYWTLSVAFGWNGRRPETPPPLPPPAPPSPPPPADADHDGVLDAADLCPAVPMGPTPDPARRGCPLLDRDGDGVFDPDDLCPDAHHGPHPDPARRGCPSGDRDLDSVLDPVDQCPDVPRGPYPDPARPGCPHPDRDGDTIADDADRCPDRPGVPSSDPARHGCPTDVRIENGQLLLARPVHFERNRARVRRDSARLLAHLAEALRLSPQIRRVSLEGHTDDQGDDAANLDLSQRRMNSVRDWLVERGIAADRLEAHGYGEARPLVPNDSSRHRAMNRRVEFRIVDPPIGAALRASPAEASGDEAVDHGRHRRRRRR